MIQLIAKVLFQAALLLLLQPFYQRQKIQS